MIIKYIILSGMLMLSSALCHSQKSLDYPTVDVKDFPDATFGTPKKYTGSSLFGYINGGAELYLEYGFSGAWVQEIGLTGNTYTLEIYRMNTPEAAYGIFSVSRFQCQRTPPLSVYTCQTPYQLQICAGSYYISINSSKGDASDSIVPVAIGRAVVKKIHENSAVVADFFPGTNDLIVNRNAILVKGDLGIMNAIPDLAGFFEGQSGYTAAVLQLDNETVLSIRFEEVENLRQYVLKQQWNADDLKTGSSMTTEDGLVTLLNSSHLIIRLKK